MFEAVELGAKVTRSEFDKEERKLREKLLEAQLALQAREIPLLIILSGVDGSGKPDVVHRLNEWLDPRGVATHTFWETYEEERERPPFWRFWRVMPARGRGAIFFGSWYTEPLRERAYGKITKAELDARLTRITHLERMLVEDGLLLVKFWYHLTRKQQAKRLREFERDPRAKIRVGASDWRHHKLYNRFRKIAERALRETDSTYAPWLLIEAADERHRDLTTGRFLLAAMEQRLAEHKIKPPPTAIVLKSTTLQKSFRANVLDNVDLDASLSEQDYKSELLKAQARLSKLVWQSCRRKVSPMIVMEGWDGAGKGSTIRRISQAMDPRLYQVIPIAAPTDEEKAHHYLWRFWRHLPRRGKVTIFDRSWYGRVLVERVEGFASVEEWNRAYQEINEFEEELHDFGYIICKFWLHISKEEQAKRFRAREEIPYKRHKLTPEDWRNRNKWNAYEDAVNDMVARTSSEFAPWHLVPANDKRFARVHILRTICARLESQF